MKSHADQVGCYPPELKAEVDNILQDLHNSSHHTEAEFNDIVLLFIPKLLISNMFTSL